MNHASEPELHGEQFLLIAKSKTWGNWSTYNPLADLQAARQAISRYPTEHQLVGSTCEYRIMYAKLARALRVITTREYCIAINLAMICGGGHFTPTCFCNPDAPGAHRFKEKQS